MDLEQIKLLTPQQKDNYMKMERTFESDGWKQVEAWATVNKAAAMERQLNATTWEQNRIAYGSRLAFAMVEELRKATEMEFEQYAADAEAAQEEQDSLEHE